ncbi:hypothetical protein NDU88_006031 [Pleurodeles waltl]|uniref:Uncharacterized protein n=1 Tax=Pleurodeles waltl TaxID=8319 RepID=A0AAV7NS94_PLEWA|nr:hypothetical protein NDU88_006031 [Pleurodeles waltl]
MYVCGCLADYWMASLPPVGPEKQEHRSKQKGALRIIGWRLFLQWDRKNKNTGANKKVSGFVGERAGGRKKRVVCYGEQV